MKRFKKLALIVVIPAVVAGWYLFRPDKLFIDERVNEAPPAARSIDGQSAPHLLRSGMFSSDAHETRGKAEVIEVDGRRFLRLSNFATSNGPDVHVYLVRGTDASSGAAIKRAETLDLGVIKGNIGDQNYELPDDFDADEYQAVSIWCKRFGVNFGGATLRRA